MSKQPVPRTHLPAASRVDVLHIMGPIDEAKIIEILALRPSFADLEQAAICAAGDGDVLARSGHPLSGIVADIVDLLAADEEDPPPAH